jgi:predicted tellurium resistance membrane protein TerC
MNNPVQAKRSSGLQAPLAPERRRRSTRYGVAGAVVLLYPAFHTGLFIFNTSGVAAHLDYFTYYPA